MSLSKAGIERARTVLQETAGGKPLTTKQIGAARRALTLESVRQGSTPAEAAAEAVTVTSKLIGKKGRVKRPKPGRRVKVKAAGGAARESTAKPLRETLTATQAPAPARGKGAAPEPAGAAEGLWVALSSQSKDGSPFWRLPGHPAPAAGRRAAAAQAPAAGDLASMSADELRAYAAGALQDAADAHSFGGPIWQDGGLLSTARR